jgi:hypothetical protein
VKHFEKKNVNSNILYINFVSQLKLRILADFERLPIMKFNEYWCNNDLFCNVKDNLSPFSSLNPYSKDRPLFRGQMHTECYKDQCAMVP